ALREGHLRVVVAVNHQHGRAPGLDRGDRRGLPGQFRHFGTFEHVVGRLEIADDDVPVVHAVDVHAGGEQVRGAGQAERGQVAAVRAAPQPAAVRIDVGPLSQVAGGPDHVVELTGASGAVGGGLAEVEAVADAAAVVERQHHEAAQRQVLV